MRYRPNRPWMPDDDTLITQLVEQGISTQRIGVRMKRPESSVRKRAKELSLSLPTLKQRRAKAGLAPTGEWWRLIAGQHLQKKNG